MLLTIERILILKSVPIFSRVPEDYLVEVSESLREVHVEAGEPVIKKGEMGTSMFIIISGDVRVHDGHKEICRLGERAVFGELAAFDAEPRSADVTAASSAHLFQLRQNDLYDLIAEYPEILKGIMQVICQRLRASLCAGSVPAD